VLVLSGGCASTAKESFQIQPPPGNNINLTQDGKTVGSLIGTTVIKAQTYYIFSITEPFCLQYSPKTANPLQLPPALSQFRDSYTITRKDDRTYCATGNVIFEFMPTTKKLTPVILQKKIDKVMSEK
jgi:hypothetical protein